MVKPNDDQEALRDEFRSYLGDEIYVSSRDHSAWAHGTMGLDDFSLAAEDEEVVESLVRIASRATAPDAATEDRDYWHGVATKAKDQRDAALAAVERVTSTINRHETTYGGMRQMQYIIGDVRKDLAALDGAPEPEHEYQWGEPSDNFVGFESFMTEAEARADMEETSEYPSHRVMRRRPAGPWLPVEGEKPHTEHVKVTECWPMDCIEGDCDHRDEFGEPEGLESCPRAPMEVCVECMVSMGGGSDPKRWEETLLPWPCSKTVGLPIEKEQSK